VTAEPILESDGFNPDDEAERRELQALVDAEVDADPANSVWGDWRRARRHRLPSSAMVQVRPRPRR
jgi:hypothetical protein